MQKPKRSQSGPEVSANAPTSPMAMSIPAFCQAHGFSTALYFKLKRQGLAPVEMKVGTRTLISIESARDWRIAREAAGAEATEGAA
jgi:hypothetical protein